MKSCAYILTIAGKTRIVYARFIRDGGMVEFIDAVSWEPAGCAGINWWNEVKHSVEYVGPLPELPDAGRWQ